MCKINILCFLIYINLMPLYFTELYVVNQSTWLISTMIKSFQIISNYMLEFIASSFSNENSLLWIHIYFSQQAHILTVSRTDTFEVVTAKPVFTHDLLVLWPDRFLSVALAHREWGQASLSAPQSRERPWSQPFLSLPSRGRLLWRARFWSTECSTTARSEVTRMHAHAWTCPCSLLQY